MPDVVLGPGHDGSDVRLAAGEHALLRLPENATTGVRWSVERIDGPLSLVGDDYEPAPGDPAEEPPGVGAAGVRVLRFRRTGPGPASLALVRAQPWEGAASADARFSCRFPAEA